MNLSPNLAPLAERAAIAVGTRSPPLITRMRFQLPGGLFVAVLLPALLRWEADLFAGRGAWSENTMIAATLAILIGFYWMRRMGDFPGVHSGSRILLAMTVPFAILAAVFLLLRLDYSRYILATSYGLAVLWFLAIELVAKRTIVPQMAIIPGGHADTLCRLPKVRWQVLQAPPESPARLPALVADLRQDLSDDWERFIARCALAGVPVFHAKQVYESLTGKVQIEHLSENSFGSLLPSLAYLKIKQIVDWSTAALALPLFGLLLLVIGPVILLESGWPIFYTQERVGFRGRVFTVYKFRTMRRSMDDDTGAKGARAGAVTRDRDPRVTRIGHFLRTYRIDELPQILNILRGEMSWIGPRPEALVLSKWYEAELPFYCYRHVVRPGISGWAQVNQGHVAHPAQVLEKLHYDFFYIKHLSPWLDLVVAIKTVRTILGGVGAK